MTPPDKLMYHQQTGDGGLQLPDNGALGNRIIPEYG